MLFRRILFKKKFFIYFSLYLSFDSTFCLMNHALNSYNFFFPSFVFNVIINIFIVDNRDVRRQKICGSKPYIGEVLFSLKISFRTIFCMIYQASLAKNSRLAKFLHKKYFLNTQHFLKASNFFVSSHFKT